MPTKASESSSPMCRTRLFAVVTIGCIACGCGAPDRQLGIVRGKVTVNGQSLGSGSVVFENLTRGISQVADIQPDGTYEMATFEGIGIPAGEYRVAIKPSSMGTGEAPLVSTPANSVPKARTAIPDKYQHPATSPLTVRVNEGENPEFPIDL